MSLFHTPLICTADGSPADDKYALSESLCLTQPAVRWALRRIVPPYLLSNDSAAELMPPSSLCAAGLVQRWTLGAKAQAVVPVRTLFIDACARKCVYMCVVKACQWPIRGKIETLLGTDSLNQHNLLGFTIRPGGSSIARWHAGPAPAPPQTADYLLNSLQLWSCELTPLSISLCHSCGLIFLTSSHVIICLFFVDFMLGCLGSQGSDVNITRFKRNTDLMRFNWI